MHHILAAFVALFCCSVLAGQASVASVSLSEFQAINVSTLKDADGDYSDWIEIYNDNLFLVNLDGWALSDDPLNRSKFTFPPLTYLGAKARLIVFASGKDKRGSNGEIHTNFKLSSSGENLAFIDGNGQTVNEWNPAFPQQFPDRSYGFPPGSKVSTYLATPTPGLTNSGGGAVITAVSHSPQQPTAAQSLVITASLVKVPGRTTTSVTIHHRSAYNAEAQISMRDDGTGGDPVAGDDSWTGIIPNQSYTQGQMVRWRITSTDSAAATVRSPTYSNPNESAEYFGTVIQDPSSNSTLPTFEWFVRSPSSARTSAGTRCSVFYDGQFYDNLLCRLRGNTSRSYPKQSFKFDFNPKDHFRFDPNEGRVEEVNLNTTWADKSFVRQILSADTFEDAGAHTSLTFAVRVNQNSAFYSVAMFVEQPDEDYLERQGLDPNGALYKMFNELDSSTSKVEKKTRHHESHADLQTLVSSIKLSGTSLERYLLDNVDIPAVINHMACNVLIHDNDHVHKNYYLYRDSEGDLEWQFLPWDKDLTFGRNYTRTGGVLNDTIWVTKDPQSHPLYGDRQHQKIDWVYNRLIDACHRTPLVREMFLRRLRTLMDYQLQAPSTPKSLLRYNNRIAALQTLLGPDVALDQAKWGIPGWGNRRFNFAQGCQQLIDDYLAPRRGHLFITHSSSPSGIIPDRQGSWFTIDIAKIEHSPASLNQDEEYVEFYNCQSVAVDISGWTIEGGIDFTFPPGCVIPAKGSVYAVPDLPTFRSRTSGPSGNQSLLVVGPYQGHISPQETLELHNATGALVNSSGSFQLTFATTGQGDLDLQVNLAAPNTQLFVMVSTNTQGALGCGPVFGLGSDAMAAILAPLGTAPFHVMTDSLGHYAWPLPAGILPKGFTLDARAATVDSNNGRIDLSQIVRTVF